MNDGGPAFPCGGSLSDLNIIASAGLSGMSLRDWFAGKAPEVPSWWMQYEPVLTSFKYPPEFLANKDKISAWHAWGDTIDDSDLNPEWLAEFKQLAAARNAHQTTERERNEQFRITRIALWNYAYADAMLAARERKEV